MNTLRAKLVFLLAVVIISVVGVLSAVLLYLFRPPGAEPMKPVAQQILLLERIARTNPDALETSAGPAAGTDSPTATRDIREELSRRGAKLDVVVSRNLQTGGLVVSIPIEKGWIILPVAVLPPPEGGWRVIAAWLFLITMGASAIAIFVANRMIKPLVLLERAIGSVGPDAILPELPVRGPAEVRLAARALNSLSSRLKKAMESRMRLVAAAGHDMRTPITRMRLRAEFVASDDDRAMWLNDIDELDRIAESAMLLVREELGHGETERIELDHLVADIADELAQLGYAVELRKLESASVHANRFALGRAFRNIIINSATHGRGAKVSMSAAYPRLQVIIEDDGPGISPSLMGQVFEPFFRADPARRQETPGAGLGLTIAREIINKTGGEIRITNREPHGLRQVVDLPRA